MFRHSVSKLALVVAAALVACASAQQLSAAMISGWRFDEASGPALDAIDGNTGVLGSGALRMAGAIGSGAIYFTNNPWAFVDVGPGTGNNFSTTTGITIEALIRPVWSGAFGNYDEIFRKEDGGNRILLAFQNDSGTPVLGFGLNVGGAYSELDMPLDGVAGRPTLAGLKDGAWHHVVAAYDSGSGLKSLYIDGTLRFSTTLSGTIASGGAASATIGNVSPYGGEPFEGGIDEVAIYDQGLSAATIATHYSQFQGGVSYIPEPATFGLAALGAGVLGCAAWRRRCRRAK